MASWIANQSSNPAVGESPERGGYEFSFQWLCRLLQLNPEAGGEHLTSQLSWAAALLLVICVCHVYLVDKFSTLCNMAPYDWGDGGSIDIFMNGMVLLLWGAGAIVQGGYGI